MACTLRVIPEPGSGRELELGSRSWAEPLRCPASSGWPGAGDNLREVRPKSQVASRLSQPGWDFWLPGSKPMAHGAGLACGLSCPKRNLGSWSDLRDAVLFKAELALRQHLQTARVTQQGRWRRGRGASPWVDGWLLTSCQPHPARVGPPPNRPAPRAPAGPFDREAGSSDQTSGSQSGRRELPGGHRTSWGPFAGQPPLGINQRSQVLYKITPHGRLTLETYTENLLLWMLSTSSQPVFLANKCIQSAVPTNLSG